MARAVVGSLAVLVILVGGLMADDKTDQKTNKGDHKTKATITKVDKAKHTITVQMKDKNGKDVEKTFKLAEDIRMVDETGKVAAIDVFESGNDVLVLEREGQLREIQKTKTKNPKDQPKENKKGK